MALKAPQSWWNVFDLDAAESHECSFSPLIPKCLTTEILLPTFLLPPIQVLSAQVLWCQEILLHPEWMYCAVSRLEELKLGVHLRLCFHMHVCVLTVPCLPSEISPLSEAAQWGAGQGQAGGRHFWRVKSRRLSCCWDWKCANQWREGGSERRATREGGWSRRECEEQS